MAMKGYSHDITLGTKPFGTRVSDRGNERVYVKYYTITYDYNGELISGRGSCGTPCASGTRKYIFAGSRVFGG
jgi:hypothetical protein